MAKRQELAPAAQYPCGNQWHDPSGECRFGDAKCPTCGGTEAYPAEIYHPAELIIPEKHETFGEFTRRLTGVLEAIEDEPSEENQLMMQAVLQDELMPQLRHRTDAIAHVITQAEAWEAEANRLSVIARRHANAAKRLKQYVFECMVKSGIPEIKTPISKLRIQGNGGLKPLTVNEDVIDPEYKIVNLRMAFKAYAKLSEMMAVYLADHSRVVSVEVNSGRLRTDLEQGVEIMGARLEERGQHLRVEGSAIMLEPEK